MKILAANPPDVNVVKQVATLVFGVYDGRGSNWDLQDSAAMWEISFGGSAGVVALVVDDQRYCAKLYYDRRLKARLRDLLGFSKARRAYNKGLELTRRGIPCPRIVGFAAARRGTGLLVTELADGYERVDVRLERNGGRSELLRRLGGFVRGMHKAGVTHRDLSARNLLTRIDGPAEAPEFLLLDYEDAGFAAAVSTEAALENLHHLYERLLAATSDEERRALVEGYASPGNPTAWQSRLDAMITARPSKYTLPR